MTQQTQTSLDTIYALVEAYTTHHRHLRIEVKELPQDLVQFDLYAHADDMPKLAGKGGRNIRALQLIVFIMGRAAGKMYRLRLCEPTEGERAGYWPRALGDHNSFDYAKKALEDVLEAMGTVCLVTVRDTPFDHVEFVITPADDTCKLVLTLQVIEGVSGFDALTSLFKAVRHQQGCAFELVLK